LGEQALRWREADFWAYHARGLALIGYRLTPTRKFWLGLGALWNLLGNPKATLERVLN
jgi:hypothetical protein